jgi:hypothetical protein
MSAAAALRRAYDEGVHITCDGENLVLRASDPPAAEVIDLLKQHKLEIIARLKAESVRREADGVPKRNEVQPIAARGRKEMLPEIRGMKSVSLLNLARPNESSAPFLLKPGKQGDSDPSRQQIPTFFQNEGGKGGKGGEPGVSESRIGGRIGVPSQIDDPDPNPNLPWPQPGEKLLPGWGTRVSMEYRLRIASEDECLEWATEPWQLELVAKARGYSQKWVDQILLNRTTWRKAFAALDAARCPQL